MGKRIFSLLAAFLFMGLSFFHARARTAVIEPDDKSSYKAVRLVPEIYRVARADLSDLLIRDSAGEAVPYFIRSRIENERENREVYPLELIRTALEDDGFYLDYKLSAEENTDTLATEIEFTVDHKDFMKEVELWGSLDNIHWEYVQRDKLYAVDAASKLRITLLEPQKFTHYRLKLNNNLEQITFDAVNLIFSTTAVDEIYFIESLSPVYRVESADKQTKIILEGLKNLRLCDVTVHTDSMFRRTVRGEGQRGKELYHLSFDGLSYEDTTLPLEWQIATGDDYTLTISDGDDRPISVQGVTVRYYADEMIFKGNAGETYTLEFDADSGRTAPVYDIARYQDEILKGGIDRLQFREIPSSTEAPKPWKLDRALLFNIVVVAVAILLAAVILLKLRQK